MNDKKLTIKDTLYQELVEAIGQLLTDGRNKAL